MYQNCHFSSTKTESAPFGTISLWDDEKGFMRIPFRPYAYRKDPHGEDTSLSGVKLKKVSGWSVEELNAGLIYESDVDATMRTLIDRYSDSDEVSVNHRKWIIDIEVSMIGGASSPADANNEITSIALKEIGSEKRIVLVLDKDEMIRSMQVGETTIYSCESELKLLNKFLIVFTELKPTIVTGWNILEFDFPYLYNRISNVLGKKFANRISPIGHVSERINDNGRPVFSFAGISLLDYMTLYKIFTYNEESSYALDVISRKELGRGKIEYDGNLDDLFREDIEKFIKYNVEDCNLVSDIDEKLDFISLAQTICHKGHVPYEDIVYTSRFLEGAALTYMKRVGVVAPNRKKSIKLVASGHHSKGEMQLRMNKSISDEIPRKGKLKVFRTSSAVMEVNYIDVKDDCFILENPLPDVVDPTMVIKLNLIGAFVQEPVLGRHEWLYDLDLQSLYPSIIMTLNISPETKMGKVLNWDAEDFMHEVDKIYIFYSVGKKKKMNHAELKEFLHDNYYSIAANGVVYRTDTKGFLPTILDLWFNERVEYKDKMKDYKKKGDKQWTKYYNLRQLAQKVLLNAFYGVLGLQSFRFYDIENAAAVTETGRNIIKYSSDIINYYYDSILGEKFKFELMNGETITLNGNSIIDIIRNNKKQSIFVKNILETDEFII